jgi:hypothetical protein
MTQFHPGVGCNYPSKAFGLAGAVNDAFLIAETLQVRPNSPGEKEMFLLGQKTGPLGCGMKMFFVVLYA